MLGEIDLGYLESMSADSAIAQPTASFLDEARQKYFWGEITAEELAGYQAKWDQIEQGTAKQIVADTKMIQEKYSYANLYGKPLLAAGKAASDTIKNILALGLVVLAIFFITQVKQLEG
jgi:hypothetical protein